MTEPEWLASNDPAAMARFVLSLMGPGTSRPPIERRFRLFACACCRRIWDQLTHERSRGAVEVAEAFADGHATERQRAKAYTAAGAVTNTVTARWVLAAAECVQKNILPAAPSLGMNAAVAVTIGLFMQERAKSLAHEAERAHQALILRDIFGNRFRPVTLDPRWQTANIIDLARTIYEERAFDRMPILADALMDAGCDNDDILKHCRSDGPHVLGCWVVDLLLGKG